MAINKKLIHFKTFDTFNSKKLSADENNKTYTIGVNGSVQTGNPEILYQSICYIKDTKQQWTHGQLYNCNVDASNALWVDENNVVNRENLLINGTRDYTTYSYGNSEDGLMFVDTYTFEGNTLLSSISLNGSYGINLESLAVNNPNLEEATSGKMSMLSISDGQVTYEGLHRKPGEEINPAGMLTLEPGFFTYQIYHINNTTGNADPVSGLIVNESHVQLGHKSAEAIHSFVINDNGVFVDDKKVCFEMLNVTYSELKNLRDSAQLIPGAMYRITDYVCTTTQPDTASANHPFDIVVTAILNNALSEEASVVLHEGDTYFANSNLSAWKIWYTLDNNKDRFNWACNTVTALCESFDSRCPEELLNTEIVLTPYDEESYIERYKILYMYDLSSGSQVYFTTDGCIFDEGERQVGRYTTNSGKGVIYRMIDDKNNDLPYDFKNILFIENNYIYEVNELGNAISLDNPLEISYSLLADTDEEYNTKGDAIVEISQSDETPDNSGQDVWVLYKTDLGGYQEEGVDYNDMFVFVDKYDYNGQTWDRWRKAEFDGDAWHWVTHEGSSVCILTEQLLDITGNNPIYRYTFNLEEFLGDLSQADASIVAKDSESEKGIRNNYMQSCYIDYNGIGTSEYSLPINVFKITSKDCFNIYGNYFSEIYIYNTFEGEQFAVNRFDPMCSENTFTDLIMGTFGSYFCGNTLGFSNMISCGMYNMANTLGGTSLTLGNYVMDCNINGESLTVAANTVGCDISGDNAIINSINGFVDGRKSIEIPDHEYPVKVAQNSLGEIKIYNEADLIA